MDKNLDFSEREADFSDVLPDADEALYCDPLEKESETGERRFCPKNKENAKKSEKKREKGEFFG